MCGLQNVNFWTNYFFNKQFDKLEDTDFAR